MKDYTINGWNLRFDNGMSRVIRDGRDIKGENALDGLTTWQDMAPWILYGGWNRQIEKEIENGIITGTKITVERAKSLLDDLSPKETLKLINDYVAQMSITVEGDQPVIKEGEEPKKS